MFDFINVPFGYILRFFAQIFNGNFAASVFAFTLLINVILIPLSIKSQKSSVSQMRVKPKLDELKKKYGDDRRRMAEEQQKLYQEEGISFAGGCLPLIVRMVLLLSIYWLILSPLTYMAGAEKATVENVTNHMSAESNSKNSNQLRLVKVIIEDINGDENAVKNAFTDENFDSVKDDYNYVKEKYKEANINFDLFGIDLTSTPNFSFDIFNKFEWVWLLPISAFLAQMLTSVVSMRINKRINPDAPTMAGMLLIMPVISLFIGFNFPGGVCFYWICSSLIGGAIQSCVQVFYGPHRLLAREREKELSKVCDFENGQRKKFETE
ncbi:MAG: YidC/Oxa1 family membrane protein insertase [Clostridia bacterium]|nr:YidC/Oxa1 family membrane protein insertase [Clostridia bacterium]